ncbi:MAG TPA: hypothetical protein VJ724_04215, partial [Tahibacter sp.]|nr:hypothetical protein [Tahibacter sp.]
MNTPLSSIGGYFHEYPVTDFLRGGDAFTALRHTLYFSPAKFGGGAHALSPILTGETDGEVDLGATGAFNAKMRPCVPLDEPMTYVVNWGDGTQSSKTGLPTQNAPVSHVWSTSGNKALTITATQGVGPRTVNLASGRTIVSNALAPPPTPTTVTVPSTDPDGAFTLQWTGVANVEQYEIQRSSAGGAFVAVATVVAPATSKALTAQPYGNSVYRVRAVNNFGNGGWRNSANILVGHVPSTPSLTVRSLLC